MVGVDINDKLLSKGIKNGFIRIIRFDLTKKLQIDKEYDLAITCNTLHHIPLNKKQIFLENMRRVSKKYVWIMEKIYPFELGAYVLDKDSLERLVDNVFHGYRITYLVLRSSHLVFDNFIAFVDLTQKL